MQLVRSLDNQLDKSAGPSTGRGSGVTACLLPLVLLDFVSGDELEGVAKDSEAGLALLWAVIDKFVAQAITTLAA